MGVCGGHGPRRTRVGVVAHGWNIDERARRLRWCQYLRRPAAGPSGRGGGWVWWNITGWVSGSSSTLLGPQVTGHVVVVPGTGRSVDREPLTFLVGRRVRAGRGRWLFENCTVDASIFEVIKMLILHSFVGVGEPLGLCEM